MNFIVLLLLISFSFAQTALRSAVSTVDQMNEVVQTAGQVECQTLPRVTLIHDENVPVILCPPASSQFTPEEKEKLPAFMQLYGIETFPAENVTNTPEFTSFINEVKKFPPSLLEEIHSQGGKIRAIVGTGVGADPTWNQQRDAIIAGYRRTLTSKSPPAAVAQTNRYIQQTIVDYDHTSDGRSIKWLPGKAGNVTSRSIEMPTRVTINSLYKVHYADDNGKMVDAIQGSVNLFLHEHGHTLDSLYGYRSISGSPRFLQVFNSSQDYIKKITSSYEQDPVEGFAELFAYYHACKESREQMEKNAPDLAQFFKNLTSVRAYLDAGKTPPDLPKK